MAVLGPVAVVGAAHPFRRPAALELAVYLALRRQGVRHDTWPLALWPDRAVAAATVHSTASDCRRALGRGPDGSLRLPAGPVLRLTGVTTDVERFDALVAPGDVGGVVEAMHLVRGGLFEGLRHADWAVLDGTEARIRSTVASAALGSAAELVGLGRAAEAAWVVRQALRLCPFDERLYRMLLRATHAEGNRVGLRAAMDELRVLAGEGDGRRVRGARGRPPPVPDDCFHPETTALYQRLVGGAPAAGGRVARL